MMLKGVHQSLIVIKQIDNTAVCNNQLDDGYVRQAV